MVSEILKRRKVCGAECMDDLMQEARLAFLIHLRKIESVGDIRRCGKDILSALWGYWRSMAIVYAPKNCYKAVISEVYQINIEQKDVPEPCTPETETSFSVEYQDFLATLTPRERAVVQMKLDGWIGREIIPVLNLANESQMSRLLQAVRRKAHAYFEQGEEHEHR